MTILFNRGLVLAKIESTFDEDALPDNQNDAFLVIEPDFSPDITSLERENVAQHLSPEAPITGRKLAQVTFGHEVRNNGDASGATTSRLGVLLRGCGMEEFQVDGTTNANLRNLRAADANTGDMGFTVDGVQSALTHVRRVSVVITTGGASGVATANILSDAVSDLAEIRLADTDEVTLTQGSPITVHDVDGNILFDLTPDFQSNDPATGDVYVFDVLPIGWTYRPRSDGFESLTLYLYYPDDSGQSLLHKLTGSRGTFTMEASANGFGRFNFTFTGSYNAVTDVATPSGSVFETQKPQQVELAALKVADHEAIESSATLCAGQFTVDIGNDVQPRECINEADSYQGSLIVDRAPVIGFDPEAVLEATHPFWANLANATSLDFRARVGTTKGNIVTFLAPNLVYNELGYGERNSIRIYQVQGACAFLSGDGNDELEISFA